MSTSETRLLANCLCWWARCTSSRQTDLMAVAAVD